MKKLIPFIVILVLAALAFWFFARKQSPGQKSTNPTQAVNNQANPMKITSLAFLDQQNIPSKYSCDGDGTNPPLEFGDVPANAASLALIVDDPDAPNGTWTHWLIWNIAPTTKQIAENSVPQGAIQGQASSGQNVYGGPCPPSGTHRYFFKLFVLDSKLTLPSYSKVADLEKAMEGHTIAQAQLVGLYSRNK